VFKLVTALTALSKLLWVVLVGALVLAYRTFMGYRRARSSRDSQRTRHLYYQNLGNNAGVLQSLIAMVAQEEQKEAVLAYALCHQPREQSWTEDELAERAAKYLGRRFSVEVDFDARDALETLRRLDLFRSTLALRVVDVDEALPRLRRHRASGRCAAYHRAAVGDSQADE
jgi:hypothetical protein